MLFFSSFFVLLLAGVLMILWEFDHATRVRLKKGPRLGKRQGKGSWKTRPRKPRNTERIGLSFPGSSACFSSSLFACSLSR